MKVQLDIGKDTNKTLKVLKAKRDYDTIANVGERILKDACEMISETDEMISETWKKIKEKI